MEEKKDIPYLGVLNLYGDGSDKPKGLPKVTVLKSSSVDHGIIEVKRGMRAGVLRCKPGESIDWREYYS